MLQRSGAVCYGFPCSSSHSVSPTVLVLAALQQVLPLALQPSSSKRMPAFHKLSTSELHSATELTITLNVFATLWPVACKCHSVTERLAGCLKMVGMPAAAARRGRPTDSCGSNLPDTVRHTYFVQSHAIDCWQLVCSTATHAALRMPSRMHPTFATGPR
jgi:hypothetical protein